MNPVQQMVYDFYLKRVKDDKKEAAKALLQESFARQAAGTYDKEYVDQIVPKYLELVKPENLEEVIEAMRHFASTLGF